MASGQWAGAVLLHMGLLEHSRALGPGTAHTTAAAYLYMYVRSRLAGETYVRVYTPLVVLERS
jgi:hypothetical protein